MYEPPNIDADGRTLLELLNFLQTFGHRYRLWHGKNSRSALRPQELLTRLQESPTLGKLCAVQEEQVAIAGRELYAWRISFVEQKSGRAPQEKPTAYYIEDLLHSQSVLDWLYRQEPRRVVAVIWRAAPLSTFLENYYLDVLGYMPEDLTKARLPYWCVYLERLIFGLNLSGRLESVEVCAETLYAWLEGIAEIHSMGRNDNADLNDGEDEP